MGKNSSIEWTDHTFNPWWGCTKVSQACKFCYAEVWAKRTGAKLWGPRAPRRFFSEAHWREPLKWDIEAAATGRRPRVFCASMADVFEYRAELHYWRERLWDLIEQTPNLDWLLLTKRPQRIRFTRRWPEWPRNVWLGTTVEDQETAAERIPHLLENNAHVRFLSCEPLIGPLDLSRYLGLGLNWVIAGGESGGKSRPSHPRWFKSLRDQCETAGVPFLFKQWGNWSPLNAQVANSGVRVHTFPDGETVFRQNKFDSGRLLDETTWDGIPIGGYDGATPTLQTAAGRSEVPASLPA
jgi:protein gp37